MSESFKFLGTPPEIPPYPDKQMIKEMEEIWEKMVTACGIPACFCPYPLKEETKEINR